MVTAFGHTETQDWLGSFWVIPGCIALLGALGGAFGGNRSWSIATANWIPKVKCDL
jgi:hypothetical protein